MNKKLWVIGAVLAMISTNSGCVSCCHESYAKVWKNGPECDLPTPCRDQVYVFMIHGATPTTGDGLSALREKLADCGFAKVGISEFPSAIAAAFEIKTISQCNPEARFVLLGYDFGGAAAAFLARELTARTTPVDAVVLLDPLGCGQPSGVRTLLITSGTMTSTVPHSDRVVVSEANHFQLPAHPQTVTAITELLKDIALHHYQPPEDPVPFWTYKHAPEMARIPMPHESEWDFLADRGMPAPIGTQITSQTMGTPAPASPSTSAGAVMIPK